MDCPVPGPSQTAEDPSAPSTEPSLSKNARKKLAKREAFLAARPAQRRAEKERRRQRVATFKARLAAGEVEEDEVPPAKRRKPAANQNEPFAATVVIDCGFDELMMEKEIASLQQQLSHCYAINRRAEVPLERILITSHTGRLKERYDSVYATPEYLKWKRMGFAPNAWQELVTDATLARDSVVYLTADSPNVLDTLDAGKVYIIGGLVDHNRHKNICLERAKAAGVHHAQLPFGAHMSELKTRRVLTVNQVLEVMSVWLVTRDWRRALEAVVPVRKLRDPGVAPVEGE